MSMGMTAMTATELIPSAAELPTNVSAAVAAFALAGTAAVLALAARELVRFRRAARRFDVPAGAPRVGPAFLRGRVVLLEPSGMDVAYAGQRWALRLPSGALVEVDAGALVRIDRADDGSVELNAVHAGEEVYAGGVVVERPDPRGEGGGYREAPATRLVLTGTGPDRRVELSSHSFDLQGSRARQAAGWIGWALLVGLIVQVVGLGPFYARCAFGRVIEARVIGKETRLETGRRGRRSTVYELHLAIPGENWWISVDDDEWGGARVGDVVPSFGYAPSLGDNYGREPKLHLASALFVLGMLSMLCARFQGWRISTRA
jgi:hypothetical protein